MPGIKELVDSRSIVFVRTAVGKIDRGWDPTDVQRTLRHYEIATHTLEVSEIRELKTKIEKNPNAIYWPACYTLHDDPDQILVSRLLEEMHVTYAGASPRSLKFSSKIAFKERAVGIPGVRTPTYEEVAQGDAAVFPAGIQFPAMLKTEYSCNSEGVRRLDTILDFLDANRELSHLYQQRHYVEKWERMREYTVAYLPETAQRKCIIAPIGMEVQTGSQYIDVEAKALSPLVRVFALDENESWELEQMTSAVVQGMGIDGHCRLDFLRNEEGMLFVIEANFQPFMSLPKHARSYFPNAMKLSKSIKFEDIVYHILEHAILRNTAGGS